MILKTVVAHTNWDTKLMMRSPDILHHFSDKTTKTNLIVEEPKINNSLHVLNNKN